MVVYIVQADGTGDDEVSQTVADRREALAMAVEWAGHGMTNIKNHWRWPHLHARRSCRSYYQRRLLTGLDQSTSFALVIAGDAGFLTFTQCGDRPAR